MGPKCVVQGRGKNMKFLHYNSWNTIFVIKYDNFKQILLTYFAFFHIFKQNEIKCCNKTMH